MAAKLIFVIVEREVATNIKRAVEWAWGIKAAQDRCDELDKESDEYTHSLLSLPNSVDAR